MKRSYFGAVAGGVFVLLCGCDGSRTARSSAPRAVRFEDLIGNWRFVRACADPPAALQIKSLQIDFARDGTCASDIETEGNFAGMSMKGGGQRALADGVVSYASRNDTGNSGVGLESARLVLDPGLSVRKNGTVEVSDEYERWRLLTIMDCSWRSRTCNRCSKRPTPDALAQL